MKKAMIPTLEVPLRISIDPFCERWDAIAHIDDGLAVSNKTFVILSIQVFRDLNRMSLSLYQ